MSYLDKLLDGIEVKWKPLSHAENGVAVLSRGTSACSVDS